jgi:paraquat-inducible protein B
MSARANPAAIGAFVVGAVALLLTALLVWGGTGMFRTKINYVLFFDAAVTGLSKGAPVLGRGVKVGEVTDIQIRWGTPMVAVYIAIEPDAVKGAAEGGPRQALERLVREEGLRAQLRMQSFVTGVLYVALDPRPHTPIVLRGLDRQVRSFRPSRRTSRSGPRSSRGSRRRLTSFRSRSSSKTPTARLPTRELS